MLMQIIFRVDSSITMGIGHVMRCLTLAIELKKQFKGNCIFIASDHEGNINKLIIKNGFKLFVLKRKCKFVNNSNDKSWLSSSLSHDAKEVIDIIVKLNFNIDWLVVDHYSINDSWHEDVRRYVKKIIVIDDLANRKYKCDLLIDQTYGIKDRRYHGLIDSKTKLLLGADYALLQTKFYKLRGLAEVRRENLTKVKQILISMGGYDPFHISEFVVNSLIKMKLNLKVDLVISSKADNFKKLSDLSLKLTWLTLHIDADNMAELICNADLAIGAAGTSSWERACLGLPSIVISMADNQLTIAKHLSDIKAIIWLGDYSKIKSEQLILSIKKLIFDPVLYKIMVRECFKICDGLGVQRVLKMMKTL